MEKQIDFYTDKPSKIFKIYFANSVIGSMSVAIYVLFDTIFVGWGVGSDGLAALNIGIPIFNIMTGMGMLLGVGGATSMSLFMGRGETEEAKDFFPLTLAIGAIFGIVLTVIGICFLDEIIYALGADESIFLYTKDYVKPAVMFCWIYIFYYMLQVYIRNDGNPRLPMIAGVVSGVLNIFLDLLFIFKFNMGMGGAIKATLLSTCIGISILLFHFKDDKCTLTLKMPKNIFEKTLKIFKNGCPSLITELSAGIIVLLFNNRLMSLFGVDGVSAYSIIANVNYIMLAVFNGASLAIQPAVSKNIGASKNKRAIQFLKLGQICCISFGILFTLSGLLFSDKMVYLFLDNPSARVCMLSKISIEIYFFSYLFDGSNIVSGMFLQSAERSKESTVISVLRGVLLPAVGMFALPAVFGKNGIWATIVFSEVVTVIFTVIFIIITIKKLKLTDKSS